MTIALTTMAAASLAILVYIAVVITGTYTAQNISPSGSSSNINASLAEQAKLDSATSKQIASSLDYIHKSDTNIAPLIIPLHGINLTANQFILLYDSTPYATKGHIALNLPCDASTPNNPIFQVLVGRAPKFNPLPLGYLSQISAAPRTCIYHGQFGFADLVTDIALKNISGKTISLGGPHSVAISAHEFFTPTTPSLEQLQHKQQK